MQRASKGVKAGARTRRAKAAALATIARMVERDDGSKNRQSAEAYARYLAGMDASMRQKVALTAAHILSEGDVADMGMGSGEGSAALAALYPSLRVIGVDLDPEMVARASAKHVHPNLRFVTGNIAEPVFADAEIEGIFDSSVLHHVTTFGTPSYDHEHAARCLEVQARALAVGGVLVVRDFLVPEGADEEVLLDLSSEDRGLPLGSEADVARRTAREWRALSDRPGFRMTELEAPAPGWARFRLALRHATEIVLRKDYRDDWAAEIKEEYTYFDRARFEAVFASLGLRVLGSSPIRNPWIVRHRFEGKVALRALDGTLLDHPPTNYVIVGERVEAGASVRFRDAGEDTPRGFLEASRFEHKATGQRRDVVRRPGVVADVVPFFVHEDRLYVLARTSYPRPILGTSLVAEPALDGSGVVPWLAEPMHVQLTDKPIAQAVEEELWKTARLSSDAIQRVLAGTTYYPSPGGLQEEVRSIFVEIAPSFDDVPLVGVSPFSTSGRIRPVEAQQVLRAAQVGGLTDARLELNVRSLLTRLGRAHGPWIADQPEVILESQGLAAHRATWQELLDRPSRRAFRAIEAGDGPSFLALHARRFEELDSEGRVLSSAVLELVVPRTRSATSVAAAPIARIEGRLCLGIDDDDFPAAQCFHGASEILVAPAWRLPREVLSGRAPIRETRAFLTERFAEEHGLEVGEIVELGGRYHPSAGVTPEVVHPWLVIVRGVLDRPSARRLRFVPLEEVVRAADRIVDGHLRVVALRSASMLGLVA
jgi:ubiquinone/menaquinone biosynthesis C-methylase UbiE